MRSFGVFSNAAVSVAGSTAAAGTGAPGTVHNLDNLRRLNGICFTLEVVSQFADQEIVDTALGALLQSPSGNTDYIFQVRTDNSANTSAVYLKIYDNLVRIICFVGSTHPDFIFFHVQKVLLSSALSRCIYC